MTAQGTVRAWIQASMMSAFMAASAGAQQPTLPPAVPKPSVTPRSIPSDAQPPQPPDSQEHMLKFDSAPLDVVVADYGARTGRTMLLGPGLSNVTVTLRTQQKVSADECVVLIEQALAMYGVAIIDIDANTSKVVSINTVHQETLTIVEQGASDATRQSHGVVTRLVTLKYMDPSEAARLITPLKRPYGVVQAIDRINGLLVTDTQDNVKRIMHFVELVDQPIGHRAELFVLPVRNARASHLKELLDEVDGNPAPEPPSGAPAASPGPPGVIRARTPMAPPSVPEFNPPPSAAILKRPVKILADDRANVLVIITLAENMPFLEKIVKVLDVAVEKTP